MSKESLDLVNLEEESHPSTTNNEFVSLLISDHLKILEEKYEKKLEEKFEEKYEKKLEEKFEEKYEKKLEEKFEEKYEEKFEEKFEEKYEKKLEEKYEKKLDEAKKELKEELKKDLKKELKEDYEEKIKEVKDDHEEMLEKQGRKIKKLQGGPNEEEEEEEDEQEKDTKKLPQDTFSFLICSKPNSLAFWFAFSVFATQMIIFSLLVYNRITFGSDNKLSIPDCVGREVLVTQVIAIVISVYIQDDFRVALEQFFAGYSQHMVIAFKHDQHDVAHWKWVMSQTCRLLEGAFSLVISFFLIIAVDNVFDLLLNFTAMAFVSEFDDIAFKLALSGYFGFFVKKKSEIIEQTSYKVSESEEGPKRRTCGYQGISIHIGMIVLFLATFSMIIAWFIFKPLAPVSRCLCNFAYAGFGDNALPQLGSHSGIYIKKGDRKDYKNSRAQYVKMESDSDFFSYSKELEAWTFSYCDEDNDCGWKARSFQTSSIDLVRSTSASPWIANNEIQLDYFRLSCLDEEILSHDLLKKCKYKTNGPFCTNQEPCRTMEQQIESKGFANPDPDSDEKYSRNYELFLYNNINVQSHGQPVYLGNEDEGNYNDIIYFTGRHWAFSHTNKSKSMLANCFRPGSQQHNLQIAFISESVIIKNSVFDAISPASLSWYHEKSINNSGIAYPDFERPIDSELFCSFCNNVSNPCKYEGQCNSDDGKCTCRYDATGSLCSIPPTGNGKCDPYFNEVEFGFDGGDCCGATCQASKTHVCGIGKVQRAFGVDLTSAADGFQNCKDTSMVPITIDLSIAPEYYSRDEYNGAVSLVCDNITYLYISPGGLQRDASYQFKTETVFVKDGTECKFSSRATSDPDQHNYTIYDSADTVLAHNSGRYDLSSSFSVLSACLLTELSKITNQTLLQNESTPQGKAIRWLNSDESQFSNCESTFLFQRYLLASLDYTLREVPYWISWLSSESECKWKLDSIVCNKDSFVSQLDMVNKNLKGMIPSEIFGLTNLETLDLWRNELTGPLPSELGQLTNLERLYLKDNQLTGPIPLELGQFTNLELLDLSYNKLTGPLPLELGLLTNLERLYLEVNQLTGPIPLELGQFTNLELFYIFQNDLTGEFPKELCEVKRTNNMNYFFIDCEEISCDCCVDTCPNPPRILNSTSSTENCLDGMTLLQIATGTDRDPEGVEWDVVDESTNETLLQGGSLTQDDLLNTILQETCVPNDACLVFTIRGSNGDGYNGNGYYRDNTGDRFMVHLNGGEVSNGRFEDFQKDEGFFVGKTSSCEATDRQKSCSVTRPMCDSTVLECSLDNDGGLSGFCVPNEPSISPSISRTVSPSSSPSSNPTYTFTPCNDGLSNIVIELTTDYYSKDTSWELVNKATGDVILKDSYDSADLLQTFVSQTCTSNDACLVFTIYDSDGSGLLEGGGYVIYVNNEQVASGGGKFGYSETKLLGSCQEMSFPKSFPNVSPSTSSSMPAASPTIQTETPTAIVEDNESFSSPCQDGMVNFTVEIAIENDPERVAWTVVNRNSWSTPSGDSSGNEASILLQGGPYSLENDTMNGNGEGSTVVQSICVVSDACLVFEIQDAEGAAVANNDNNELLYTSNADNESVLATVNLFVNDIRIAIATFLGPTATTEVGAC